VVSSLRNLPYNLEYAMKNIKKRLAALLVVLAFSSAAFGQTSTATVSGTVQDASGAFIPGVSVTATNTTTNVATSTVSNEAGAYNIPALQPGTYAVTAELPGFQIARYTAVEMRTSAQIRLNFTLRVAGVATAVEVAVSADQLLVESSSSVGGLLKAQEVRDMPLVDNNVLDLVQVTAGIVASTNDTAFGAEDTRFAGVSAMSVNISRDGIPVQDQRWPTGISGSTVVHPDLVGEMQIILAPVDAEMGRGNGQVQITTRSGGNAFHGAAVWDVQNSALDANTWTNNRSGVIPDWRNKQQYTVSLGGPIVKNRTFFFALWDQQRSRFRTNQNPVVPTPCALNGIFRYYDNWQNGNFLTQTNAGGTAPTIAVVNVDGSPRAPSVNPDQTAHNGILRYASVWGPITNIPANVAPDCSNMVVNRSSPWDPNRRTFERTGYLQMLIDDFLPSPNNYDVGDGLNTAGHRWVRGQSGSDNIFGISDASNRKQINLNLDHIINQKHKVHGSYTYELNTADGGLPAIPTSDFRSRQIRRPQVLAVNLVSTLSPTMFNEVRLGMSRTGVNNYSQLDNPETGDALRALLPKANGLTVVPAFGQRQVVLPGGGLIIARSPVTVRDSSPRWSFGDTLSWTRGRHAFKVGGTFTIANSKTINVGEIQSNTTSGGGAYPTAGGGTTALAPVAGINTTAFRTASSPAPGILQGNSTSGNQARMEDLLVFLNGSMGSVVQWRFINRPEQFTSGIWNDPFKETESIRDIHQNEFSTFFKDDWKATNKLTLNLGLRWDYYGVPYEEYGMTAGFRDGGLELFGMSGRSFDTWFKPGANARDAQVILVGPNSPNPKLRVYQRDWNNIAPAVGFAYQIGAPGRTTLRGGYQVSFLGGGQGDVIGDIVGQGGIGYPATFNGPGAGTYFDLQDVINQTGIPVNPPFPAGNAIPRTDRDTLMFAFDPKLVSPYVQNLTLSLIHRVSSNLTVEGKYIGTLTRKLWGNLNINEENFLFNGLLEAFDAARRGQEHPLLDRIFHGIDMDGRGRTGIDPGATTGAQFLRTSTLGPNFQQTLARGDYQNLANGLSELNYDPARNRGLPAIPGGKGYVLRVNMDDNFIHPNPQFGNAFLRTNLGHSNYHSFQGQATLRPTFGVNLQASYTWSKDLQRGPNGYTAPWDRAEDYALAGRNREHQFRTFGSFRLPIGPGQPFLSNAAGAWGRIVEGWQMSWILNLLSGLPNRVVAQNMIIAAGGPDIVGPFDVRSAKAVWKQGDLAGNLFGGRYVTVRDPQCADAGIVASSLRTFCETGLGAVRDNETGNIVFRNPLPGERGNFGQNNIMGPGTWTTDMAVSKRLQLREGVGLQIRVDATNIFNHPEPVGSVGGFFGTTEGANLNINSAAPFGQLAGKRGNRTFQMKMRIDF
jgi:hypothetical protein